MHSLHPIYCWSLKSQMKRVQFFDLKIEVQGGSLQWGQPWIWTQCWWSQVGKLSVNTFSLQIYTCLQMFIEVPLFVHNNFYLQLQLSPKTWFSIQLTRYPLELHMVHRNIHDDTVKEALTHQNGLTVLGFKFKIVDDENVNET